MPIYEYRCDHGCGIIFERLIPTFSNRKEKCPMCDELCEKIMSRNNFKLKGHEGVGWGKDGYSREGSIYTDREVKNKNPKSKFKIDPNKGQGKEKKPTIKVK